MKTIFLTSFVGGYRKTQKGKEVIKIDNTNHFIDRLKSLKDKWKSFVMVCSNPDGYDKTDEYTKIFTEAFNLDGFCIENISVIDHRFKGDLEKTIFSADVVFLTGGHTPTQNKYLKEIKLDEILARYNGIVIGQSAGSMNLAKTVYAPPDSPEDLTEDFQPTFSGVGLTDIRIMPHMAGAFDDNVDGKGKSTYDYCIEDSIKYPMYGIYDYGFIEIHGSKATAYGKTLLIKNGKCIELCGDKEKIEISNNYNYINEKMK